MQNQFSRTRLLFGKPAMDTLAGSRVAVFGVGGVGGYVVEALARSGVGELDLIDDDRICLTNVNRQIFALLSTVGKYKVDAAEARVHDINRKCIVHKYKKFYLPDNASDFDFSQYDYVVDCIDTVSAKLDIVKRCYEQHIPVISCMGAANKLDPTGFKVADINKTKMDPLAKVIRKKLRKLRIPHLKVVYSEEEPLEPFDDKEISCRFHCICPSKDMRKCTDRRNIPASNAFVPPAAGLIIAGEVVKDLINAAKTMRISPEEIENSEYAAASAARAQRHEERWRELKAAERQNDIKEDKNIKTDVKQ